MAEMVYVCVAVVDMIGSPVAGSVTGLCGACGRSVWCDPASLELAKFMQHCDDPIVVCSACYGSLL